MSEQEQNKFSGKNKKKVTGKETNPPPVKQETDPLGYNPGGEKVVIDITTMKRAYQANSVFFDEAVPMTIGNVIARETFGDHCRLNPMEHQVIEVYTSTMVRLAHMMFFKQLASTLPSRFESVASILSKDAAKRVTIPIGLIPILKQYGSFESDDGDFEIEGHVTLVYSMLVRAVGLDIENYRGVQQNVDLGNAIGVNLNERDCWKHLFDWSIGVLNAYFSCHPIVLGNADQRFTLETLRVTSGLATIGGILLNPGNYPANVIRAFNIGVLAEAMKNQNPIQYGANVEVGTVQRLNDFGVVVFTWTSNDRESRFAEYYNHVQFVVDKTLKAVFECQNVTVIGTKGTMAQMVRRIDAENAVIPKKASELEMQVGQMLSTNNTGASLFRDVLRVNAPHSAVDYMVNWLAGMRVGKLKSGV